MFNSLIAGALAVSPGGREFDPLGAVVAIGVILGAVMLAYWIHKAVKRRSDDSNDDELFP